MYCLPVDSIAVYALVHKREINRLFVQDKQSFAPLYSLHHLCIGRSIGKAEKQKNRNNPNSIYGARTYGGGEDGIVEPNKQIFARLGLLTLENYYRPDTS